MADDPRSNGVVDVIARRVRTLLGNQGKSKDLIIRHLEIVSDEMADKFQSFGLRFDTRVVVLASVAANTTSLADQQDVDEPLFDLLVPESVEWKLAGQTALLWQPVTQAEVIADTNIGPDTDQSDVQADRPYVESWEWRGGTIFLSPSSAAVDLRIRGQFMPNLIDSDAANPRRAAINVLALAATGSILATDGGPAAGSALSKRTDARLMGALADFQSNQLKAQQLKPLRLGGRRSGTSNRGFQAPIE